MLVALLVTLVTTALALSALPRILDRLNPPTDDEPFYLMTAGALWEGGCFDEARWPSALDEHTLLSTSPRKRRSLLCS